MAKDRDLVRSIVFLVIVTIIPIMLYFLFIKPWIPYLKTITINNFTKQLKEMNTKYLFQALRFACLPTLSVLTLLFFGFFDISRTISFIASDNGWAVTLRILLAIAEIVLVVIMYYQYRKEGIIQDAKNGKKGDRIENMDYSRSVYRLKDEWRNSDQFNMYLTDCDDVVIIERIYKPKA